MAHTGNGNGDGTSNGNDPGTLSDFKQSLFNLSQEDVNRFKGADKTIVEG